MNASKDIVIIYLGKFTKSTKCLQSGSSARREEYSINIFVISITVVITIITLIMVIYGIAFYLERKKFFKIWMYFWASNLIQHILILLVQQNGPERLLTLLCIPVVLLTESLFLQGNFLFVEKNNNKRWVYGYTAMAVLNFMAAYFPRVRGLYILSILSLLVFSGVYTAVLFGRSPKYSKRVKSLLILLYIFLAVNRILFAYHVLFFESMIYNYTVDFACKLVITGILTIGYLKCVKEKERENQKRLQQLQGSYIAVEREAQSLKSNLEEARQLQMKLMSCQLPDLSSVSIVSEYLPAEAVGGDLYDAFLSEDQLIIYIADVSGHGISGAMISAYLKSSLKNYIIENKITEPQEVLNKIKAVVSGERLFEDRYLSLFVCNINLKTLQLKYANAGHCYPIIERNHKVFFIKPSQRVLSPYFKDTLYNNMEYQLMESDKILFYTDGLYEWRAAEGFFGLNKLFDVIYEKKMSLLTLKSIAAKAGKNGAQQDDISYIMLEIRGPVQG